MSHPAYTLSPMPEMFDEQEKYPRPDEGLEDEGRRLAGEAALVIDPRLADLWQLVWTRPDHPDPDSVPLGSLAALLRLAYAQGYADAHSEETVGSLYLELGLPAPRTGRAGSRSAPRSRRGRAASGNLDR